MAGRRTWKTVLLVAGGALLLHAPLHGEDQQPTLDDLLNLPRGQQQPAEETPAEPEDKTPLERSVEKRLTAEEAADLFKQLIRDMDDVADRLGVKHDAGLATQRKQEEILSKLDQVIATARQQQQQGGGGGGGSQQQARQQDPGAGDPAAQQNQQGEGQAGEQAGAGENQDNFSPGNVRAGDNEDRAMNENRVEWGSLPPRLRDELQQGFGERFSPIYRDLTEAYYKRLAEEGK